MAKQWTPEERKIASDRAKAWHAAQKAKAAEATAQPAPAAQPVVEQAQPAPKADTIETSDDIKQLLARIQELEAAQWRTSQQPAAQVSGNRLVGTTERYRTDKSLYPDPTARLAQEPRLQRFAFQQNYELQFSISSVEYTTIDNLRMREPKFSLELVRVIYDEVTGEATNGRYVVCRLVFFEDPDTALTVARDNNIAVDEADELAFLNEMRYLRMRDWLLECFYPAPVKPTNNKREMVIDGKVVEYFEVNSETSAKIPFSQLDGKL